MIDIGQIAVAARVADLARRNGIRPSEASATLRCEIDEATGEGKYTLSLSGRPVDPVVNEKFDKIKELLGCNGRGDLVTEYLDEMEDIVERAVALSPRSRTR